MVTDASRFPHQSLTDRTGARERSGNTAEVIERTHDVINQGRTMSRPRGEKVRENHRGKKVETEKEKERAREEWRA